MRDGNIQLQFPADLPKETVRSALLKYLQDRDAKDPTPAKNYRGNYDVQIDDIMGPYEPRSLGKILFGATTAGLALPAFLFLAGWTVWWVGNGFRRPPSSL
jgi:hypothetical protein